MTEELATIYIDGNSEILIEQFTKELKQKKLKVENKTPKGCDYQLIILDLDKISIDENELQDSLKKAENFTEGKTCLLVALSSHQDKSTTEDLHRLTQKLLNDKRLNLRVIFAYDIYLTDNKYRNSAFQVWIGHAIQENKITVSEKGNLKYFPLATKEVCNLVLKSLFISNTSGLEFTAAGEELSDLEIAYLLKKNLDRIGRKLELDLSGRYKPIIGNIGDSSIETQAILNWSPEQSLSGDLETMIVESKIEESEITIPDTNRLQRLETNIEKKKSSPKTNLFRQRPKKDKETKIRTPTPAVYIAILLVLTLISVPFITTFIGITFSSKLTEKALHEIRNGESQKSQKNLNRAITYQWLGENSFRSILGLGNLISKNEINSLNNFLLILDDTQKLISSLISTYDLGNKLYQGLLGKENIEIKSLTAAIRVNLITITERLSQLQLSQDQYKTRFNFLKNEDLTQLNQQISLLKTQISDAIPLLDIVEKIGTTQGIQRFLVIIQDTNELRPTGGYISSYGLMTLDQGKLISFQIDSSLSLDKLTNENVPPPLIIRQLLDQSNWSFHDSNIDADFVNSAIQMAWFYQKYKAVTVDGIIGLNLNYLYFLLDQMGPIVLADGQTISQNNLFALASNPTASKGLDIITALTQDLSKKLSNGEIRFADFSKSILKTIAFNEINVWFANPKLESLSLDSNISGAIEEKGCHPQLGNLGCRADTIYLNESNMSLNKLNYYLKRNQNLTVQIDELGRVNYTLDYDYQYPVPVPLNILGSYKAYYQLYLPANSEAVAISLDGQPIPEKVQIKKVISTLLKVEFSAGLSINQNHRLEIRFTSPNSLDTKKPLIPYTIALLKQPGVLNDNLNLKILFPSSLTPKKMTIPLKQVNAQELVFQTNKISYENIGIIFKNQAL